MPEYAQLELPDDPKLAGNIMHFARSLRRAGISIGPGRVLDAIRAVSAAGFTERRDFYWTLHACFVSRPEQRVVFAQVFRLYWRDPRYLEHMMAAMVPAVRGVQEDRGAQAAEKRAAEALLDGAEAPEANPKKEDEDSGTEIEIDASFTMSAEEKLKTLDFEQMSTAEMAQAKAILARLKLPVDPIRARRTRAADAGRIDAARTLRAAMRQGGELHDLKWKTPKAAISKPCCTLRYLWLHEPVFSGCFALLARGIECKGRGLGKGTCLYVWYAAYEYHPSSGPARCGRSPESSRSRGTRLGRGHADRSMSGGF